MEKPKVCLLMMLTGLLCSVQTVTCHSVWIRRAADGSCNSTPANFNETYSRECNQLIMDNRQCARAWTAFSQAFAGRDQSAVVASNYSSYFSVLPIEAQSSQNLFWSGVMELADMVSCMCPTGASVVSSFNVPASAIFNNIGSVNWCGTTDYSSSSDGIEYTERCMCSVTSAFWEEFSRQFALSASGTAFYLGYGEKNGGTFQSSSFFAMTELPNLNPPRVSDVLAMIVHRKGQGESCGDGTVEILQSRVIEKKLNFSCYDVFGDPKDTSQVQDLSACATRIISAVQQGMEPEPDDCFAKQIANSGIIILPEKFTITVLLLLLVTVYDSLL